MYWVLLLLLILTIWYVATNRDTIILEHLDATAGPMNSKKGPAPAAPTAADTKSSELTAGQMDVCSKLKQARDSTNPLEKATFKAASDQGKIPEYCKKMLNDLSDVSALASKLTTLQQEVDQMKAQAKDQSAQAEAAKASLQAMT
jgi:uncharacterized small protein (DUF1192 family)